MSNEDDIKALNLLEKAVHKAEESLTQTKYFQPFLMLLTDTGKIEIYENEETDSTKSYASLEEILRKRIKNGDVDIMILAVDTVIPDRFVKDISSGIRLHLEEKSQKYKDISGRFIYVPYELCQIKDKEIFVRLHAPIPVGFPAEYIA
jgi:hypothetical protein